MPQTITSIKDAELQRLKRNQTDAQKKNSDATKEGVVVNSFYKEPKTEDIHELYDSLVISDSARMPEKLKEQEQTTKEKKLMKANLILKFNDMQYCEQCVSWYDYSVTPCCPCCGN